MRMVENYAHRGGAGLTAENSLLSCQTALTIGVDVIDMDIHLTRDNIVVAYHDSVLNPATTRNQDKQWVTKENRLVVKNLNFSQLQRFDIGRLNLLDPYAGNYPIQKGYDNIKIPSLCEIIKCIKHASSNVRLQVELKIKPNELDISPDRQKFVNALLNDLWAEEFVDRIEFQSFDWQILLMIKQRQPDAKLSFLTEESEKFNNILMGERTGISWTAGYRIQDYDYSVPKMIANAGGSVWNPHFKDLTEQRISEAHMLNLRVVPWTIDNEKEMIQLLDMGVDGLLTNRPDILRGILAARQIPLAKPGHYD